MSRPWAHSSLPGPHQIQVTHPHARLPLGALPAGPGTHSSTLTHDSDTRSPTPEPGVILSSLSCAEVRICNKPTFYPRKLTLTQGLYPLPHILASHCLPAAGQSCCGPASKMQGLVPGPAAGTSTPTDKDVGCPVQLLVLPDQRRSAGDSRGPKSGPVGQYATPIPSKLLPCGCCFEGMPISRTTLALLPLGNPLP